MSSSRDNQYYRKHEVKRQKITSQEDEQECLGGSLPIWMDETDEVGKYPLHKAISAYKTPTDEVLLEIESHTESLGHQNRRGYLPLHIECLGHCRSAILRRCIELYPEALAIADREECLPLHRLLMNRLSTQDDVSLMIEKYPAALKHRNFYNNLAIHIECRNQCRLSIISKCIELYPESLAHTGETSNLPLHCLLWKESFTSSIDLALLMIEKYPAAITHKNSDNYLPIHIECKQQCRSAIISKCIEVYPESWSSSSSS
jgi:hypothetical protein